MRDHEDEWSQDSETADEPDWDEYRAYVKQTNEQVRLEGKDYIALFIASLQTIFLPFIILMVVILAIAMLIFLLV